MSAIHTIGTLSGGIGSWGACRRWIDINGPDGMVLLFADVSGDDPETGEDADTLRFLNDCAADLGTPLVKIRDGRSIWDVFTEKHWLGNTQVAHCSWELKTAPARAWIDANAPQAERIIVGIDVTEANRLPAITGKWAPLEVVTPLFDRPMLWKPQLKQMARDRGLRLPRMYELGYAHANCRICVKAGHASFARTLRIWPEVYAYAEAQEEKFRAAHGDVAILRDRTGGTTKPETLRQFRERLESANGGCSLFDELEEGGCACF